MRKTTNLNWLARFLNHQQFPHVSGAKVRKPDPRNLSIKIGQVDNTHKVGARVGYLFIFGHLTPAGSISSQGPPSRCEKAIRSWIEIHDINWVWLPVGTVSTRKIPLLLSEAYTTVPGIPGKGPHPRCIFWGVLSHPDWWHSKST